MGKKLKNQDIAQYIFDDYIFNRELTKNDEVIRNMDLLVENELAVKITGTDDLLVPGLSRYRVASKFMMKYNKELKKRQRRPESGEDGVDKVLASTDTRLTELNKYGLDFGIHYAVLGDDKHDDYMMMVVKPGDDTDPFYVSYSIYFIGYRCKKFKNKFFKMYDEYKKIKDDEKVEGIIYTDGKPFKETIFKSFDQMVFHDKDKIIEYIDNWKENIPKYSKYGMIAKLSILLYGEPGTGKSTFYKALAKYLGIETVRVMLPNYFSGNDMNQKGRSYGSYSYGSGVINVIDDIDCISKSREDNTSNENGQILSTLLEFLDNPPTFYFKANDGLYYPVSIVVATTNYYDKLDEAVRRYGRFDLKICMKPFNFSEAKEMCAIYDLKLRDVIPENIDKDTFSISPAQLQALCMENIDKSFKKIK